MDIELVGFVNWIDFKKKEITFWCPSAGEKLRLDMFTGIEKFRKLPGELKETVLDIIIRNKGRFKAIGYCYNSKTLVADSIEFNFGEELEEFMKSIGNVDFGDEDEN